jgi:hypothetical protein
MSRVALFAFSRFQCQQAMKKGDFSMAGYAIEMFALWKRIVYYSKRECVYDVFLARQEAGI